jgi:hypothetical protein
MVPKPYEDLFRNVGKILDVAPAVRVTYNVDHKRFVISVISDGFAQKPGFPPGFAPPAQKVGMPLSYLDVFKYRWSLGTQINLVEPRGKTAAVNDPS